VLSSVTVCTCALHYHYNLERALAAGYRQTPMPSRLFHPDYRAGFRFGAATLRPGMKAGDIAAALRQIVADATGPY
jgi:hypothetical protein